MWPPKTILHPTDFSECSEHAFQLACELAHQSHAKLIVLHAHPPMMTAVGEVPPIAVEVEDEAESIRRLGKNQPVHPDVLVEHCMKTGPAVEVILEAARQYQVELIVIGTHGRKGINRIFLGSVAEHVIRRSPCPVLTASPPWEKSLIETSSNKQRLMLMNQDRTSLLKINNVSVLHP